MIAALQVPKALRLRHGALKNLLAGATCVVHHDPWEPALDEMDFPVSLLRDYGWSYALGWPDYGPPVRQSFAATPIDQPWLIHLAEGTDATAQAELTQLDRMGCLAANSVLVHGVGLREQDIDRVIERRRGGGLVSDQQPQPCLGGRWIHGGYARRVGLPWAATSRLSGARDLLDEMRGVRRSRRAEPGPVAFRLVTSQAARILRLSSSGSLTPGAPADLVIVEDRGGDERCGLVGIEHSQIRAVVGR